MLDRRVQSCSISAGPFHPVVDPQIVHKACAAMRRIVSVAKMGSASIEMILQIVVLVGLSSWRRLPLEL